MKVILCMAQTLNGMIARENGKEDFLSHVNWKVFVELAEEMGCFIIGRKTYSMYLKKKSKVYSFDRVNAKKVIISRDKKYKLVKDYVSANSPRDALNKASKLGFRKVLLTGGGVLNSAFMKAGLVDEVIMNIEPFVLGRGISVFSEAVFEDRLQLLGVKKVKGIVQLHYKIKKQS